MSEYGFDLQDSSGVTIRVRDDGPLVLHGRVVVVDAQGVPFSLPENKPNVALCRCGRSDDKPFCDGSHRGCGFQSRPKAEE